MKEPASNTDSTKKAKFQRPGYEVQTTVIKVRLLQGFGKRVAIHSRLPPRTGKSKRYIDHHTGPDSSVGIATGLSGNRITAGARFFAPDRPWGLTSLPYNGYRVIPGGKAAGAWR